MLIVSHPRESHNPWQRTVVGACCLKHHHIRAALVVVLCPWIILRKHTVPIEHNSVASRRHIVLRRRAVRSRQHNPSKSLTLIQVAHLLLAISIDIPLGDGHILLRHPRHQSPVRPISHALIFPSLDVERLASSLVVDPPRVLRSSRPIVGEHITSIASHIPRLVGDALHMLNARRRATQVCITPNTIEPPNLQRLKHRLTPHHEVVYRQRVPAIRPTRQAEATLQRSVEVSRSETLGSSVAEDSMTVGIDAIRARADMNTLEKSNKLTSRVSLNLRKEVFSALAGHILLNLCCGHTTSATATVGNSRNLFLYLL